MARNVTVELDTKVLDNLIKHLNGNVEEAVNKAGFVVEGKAKLRAPIDTGALRASIYTSIKGNRQRFESAKGKAIAESHNVNSRGRIQPLTNEDIVQLPEPKDNHTVYVGPSVEYGAEVELGGQHAAQPYLLPAMRETERELRDLLKKAVTP